MSTRVAARLSQLERGTGEHRAGRSGDSVEPRSPGSYVV